VLIRSHIEASTAATAAPPGGSEAGAGRADPPRHLTDPSRAGEF
jgi:hypothetical protein